MQELGNKLTGLLDRFERDVRPYDRLATLGFVLTPIAVVLTILFGWLLAPPLPHDAMLKSLVTQDRLYWVVGGILATLVGAKLPIFIAERKKHQISNTKYKPLSGGKCMCDLSQLRYHMGRLEKTGHEGERIRHSRMISYYRQRLDL